MTEYEMADLLTSTTLAAVETFSTYISLTVAYLVATYLVGQKLTTAQMTTVSILYVVTASIVVWALYSYMSRVVPIADALEVINPGVNYGAQPMTRDILSGVMALGILASLNFMWGVRHPKAD